MKANVEDQIGDKLFDRVKVVELSRRVDLYTKEEVESRRCQKQRQGKHIDDLHQPKEFASAGNGCVHCVRNASHRQAVEDARASGLHAASLAASSLVSGGGRNVRVLALRSFQTTQDHEASFHLPLQYALHLGLLRSNDAHNPSAPNVLRDAVGAP